MGWDVVTGSTLWVGGNQVRHFKAMRAEINAHRLPRTAFKAERYADLTLRFQVSFFFSFSFFYFSLSPPLI